VYLKKLGIMCI